MRNMSKVLVVDDDLAVRLRLGDLLAQAGGLAVREAESGPSGLALALADPPDLILLDIMMPGMTGIDVCRFLRADARTREVAIIVLSAAEESEAMISALEAGADDFLRKPFSASEVRAKVRTITRLNRFRAIAAERDRFRWLFDHSLEPLLIADDKGMLTYANPRAREVFDLPEAGVDVADAIGRHFRAEPADAWAAWRELRLPLTEPFAIFQVETAHTEARWYGVELHALDGDATQTLLKFTHRSGSVQRELESYAFQRLICHKIRTPLTGLGPIFAYLEENEGTTADAATRELLHLARQSAERLEKTLQGILDYHAALFGKVPVTLATYKPVAEILSTAAGEAGLAGRIRFDATGAMLAHPERLEIVVGELLENYVKFSDAASTGVEISLRPRRGRWELSFFAAGPGLPPEVVANLGRPYVQLERRFSGEIPGVGLGLATVRILLRSIGGDIVFASGETTPGLASVVHLPLEMVRFSNSPTGEYSA